MGGNSSSRTQGGPGGPRKRKRRGEVGKEAPALEVLAEAGVAPDTADPEDELGEDVVTAVNRETAGGRATAAFWADFCGVGGQ